MTFEELDDWEGLNFDLIVIVGAEAHHRALELTRASAVDVEYWPTADPSRRRGQSRDSGSTPTAVRDQLLDHIRQRLAGREHGQRIVAHQRLRPMLL